MTLNQPIAESSLSSLALVTILVTNATVLNKLLNVILVTREIVCDEKDYLQRSRARNVIYTSVAAHNYKETPFKNESCLKDQVRYI